MGLDGYKRQEQRRQDQNIIKRSIMEFQQVPQKELLLSLIYEGAADYLRSDELLEEDRSITEQIKQLQESICVGCKKYTTNVCDIITNSYCHLAGLSLETRFSDILGSQVFTLKKIRKAS